jgi:TnpA family transposase
VKITPKKIERLIKWHSKNGEWGLQLSCIWRYLTDMQYTANEQTRKDIQDQLNKIETALGAEEVMRLYQPLFASHQ